MLSQSHGVDKAFPDDELSLAREAGRDRLALVLPFPVRKSLFNNHHKITNTGWWSGLGMGATLRAVLWTGENVPALDRGGGLTTVNVPTASDLYSLTW